MEHGPVFAVVFRAKFHFLGYMANVNAILPRSPVVCTAPHSQRAYVYQSVHAQTRITSMFESIRLPEHPCPNQKNIHVREHTFVRAPMPKP